MKKMLFALFVILSCSFVQASNPEHVDILSGKVVLQNSNGYFVFSNGSCWKAIGFAPRWRTLSEWWNNVEIVPQTYQCVPSDWVLGTQIDVYTKFGNLNVNEADASNQDQLKQCTHLLHNKRTGQILFAIALHPADCIGQVFAEAKKDGYDEGYTKGRLSNYQNATEIYNDGYKAGYTKGFKAAYEGEQPGN